MAGEILIQDTQSELEDRFLLFYINEMLHSVELRYVLEIITVQRITHLPNLPCYIKGIINLRGKVIPVIDMRLKLGLEERAYDDKTCIVVIDINEMHIGLIVDSVSEVVTIPKSKVSATPPGDVAAKYVSSISTHNEGMVLNIDCEKFLLEDLDTVTAG